MATVGCDKATIEPQAGTTSQAQGGSTASKPKGILEVLKAVIDLLSGDLIHGDFSFMSGMWFEGMRTTTTTNADGSSTTTSTYFKGCLPPSSAICKLNASGGAGMVAHNEEQDEGCMVASIGYYEETNQMFMVIYRASLSQGTYNNLYADGVAEIPQDWIVQDEVCRLAHLPAGYKVRAGNYDVYPEKLTTGEDVLIVLF